MYSNDDYDDYDNNKQFVGTYCQLADYNIPNKFLTGGF